MNAQTPHTPTPPKEDVQGLIGEVNTFLADEIENGTAPWEGNTPPRRMTGEPFQGINNLSLATAQTKHGYTSPFWLTPRQAKAMGGQVRDGEAGMPVLLVKTITDEETGETRQEGTGYRVYNASQIDGLPEVFYKPAQTPPVQNQDLDEMAQGMGLVRQAAGPGSAAEYDRQNHILKHPPHEIEDNAQYTGAYSHAVAKAGLYSGKVKTGFKHNGNPHRLDFLASITGAFTSRHLGQRGQPPLDPASKKAFAQIMREDQNAIFSIASKSEVAAGKILEKTPHHKADARKARYTEGLDIDALKAKTGANARANAVMEKPNLGANPLTPTKASQEYRRQREEKRRAFQRKLDQMENTGKRKGQKLVHDFFALAEDFTR
jgi:antirestriction protein ArdC